MAIQASQTAKAPVAALLLVDMVVNGGRHEAGEVQTISAAEFSRFNRFARVTEATPENIAAFKAKQAADKERADKAAALDLSPANFAALRDQIAELTAKVAKLEAKK